MSPPLSVVEIVGKIYVASLELSDTHRSICLWTTQKKKPIFTHALAHGIEKTVSESGEVTQKPRWITAVTTLRYSDLFASGSHCMFVESRKLIFFRLLGWRDPTVEAGIDIEIVLTCRMCFCPRSCQFSATAHAA